MGTHLISLDLFAQLVTLDHGLTVVTTRRPDKSPHATVVNAGVLTHPVNGRPAVAFVAAGESRKLVHLRADPLAALTVRAGWQWATVEGEATLIGPDDSDRALDEDAVRLLLRDVFRAAGGTHDDWAEYDRTMREERRTAVVVAPTRVYTNPT